MFGARFKTSLRENKYTNIGVIVPVSINNVISRMEELHLIFNSWRGTICKSIWPEYKEEYAGYV